MPSSEAEMIGAKSFDQGAAEVNRNVWEGDPESQGQIDSLLQRDKSLFVLLSIYYFFHS